MRRFITPVLLVLIAGLVVWQLVARTANRAEAEERSVRSTAGNDLIKAADFTLKDLGGNDISLSDFSGNVVILDFWATWCPPCVKEIPHFNELAAKYGEKGLVVFGISVDRDGKPAVEKFQKKQALDYHIAFTDAKTYATYQSYLSEDMRGGIPFTFVIDRKGNIREKFVGYRPKEVFEEAIQPLLLKQY